MGVTYEGTGQKEVSRSGAAGRTSPIVGRSGELVSNNPPALSFFAALAASRPGSSPPAAAATTAAAAAAPTPALAPAPAPDAARTVQKSQRAQSTRPRSGACPHGSS
jgi:hypothetical protein